MKLIFCNCTQVEMATILKERRKDLGFTQEKVGQEVGVSRQRLAEIENGDDAVSLYLLQKIAKALSLQLQFDVVVLDSNKGRTL